VRLDVRSTQAPPHDVRLPAPASDIEQLVVQAPWLQTSPVAHFVPQLPQFAGSVA
jgi:hypothetical protein